MLRKERLNFILDKLEEDGKISINTLSLELGVSDDTIRRDLNELANENKLEKVHGGALSKALHPLNYSTRIGFLKENKLLIAKKAITLLTSGQVVIIDAGTTNYYIAKMIPDSFEGVVFTNSLPIAAELLRCKNLETRFLGGLLQAGPQAVYDLECLKTLENIFADVCLLGVCSIDLQAGGVYANNREEAVVKSQMSLSAQKVVIPLTSDKIGVKDYFRFCLLNDIHQVVSDDMLKENDRKLLAGKLFEG